MKLNKKQKRTATIASMAALLAVVLGMGGQTFAKYVTTNTVTADSAVVAKWGIVIRNSVDSDEITGVAKKDIFANTYGNNGAITGFDDSKVVAPGAKGSVTVEVSGCAEVDLTLTSKFDGWTEVVLSKNSTAVYFPITWSLTIDGTKTEYVSTADTSAETKMKTAIDTYLGAKIESAKVISKMFTIGWEWKYNNGNDTYDTYCGQIAANGTSLTEGTDVYSLDSTIGFSVITTATQVETTY